MASVQSRYYGNASSVHGKGLEAERLINSARSEVAKALGVDPADIIFTSGGTESNNIAIKGIARRYHRRGKHIITTPIEHPSTLYACRQLEKEGFEISFIEVDKNGQIVLRHLEELITPQTTLVSIIHKMCIRDRVIAGDNDSLIPIEAVKKTAAKMKRAEFMSLPLNHFDPYLGEPFNQVSKKQLDFLKTHL